VARSRGEGSQKNKGVGIHQSYSQVNENASWSRESARRGGTKMVGKVRTAGQKKRGRYLSNSSEEKLEKKV